MTRTFTPRGWAAVLGAAVLIGLVAVTRCGPPQFALINESRSLPPGLYLREFGRDPERGAVAAAAQPPVARAYLAGLGAPSDMLLLKRVAAVGGDRVCREGDRVDTPVGAVAVLVRDRDGVPLAAWRGCRRLDMDELFLLGETATSYDSRYFGPVRRAGVKGVYRRVIPW